MLIRNIDQLLIYNIFSKKKLQHFKSTRKYEWILYFHINYVYQTRLCISNQKHIFPIVKIRRKKKKYRTIQPTLIDPDRFWKNPNHWIQQQNKSKENQITTFLNTILRKYCFFSNKSCLKHKKSALITFVTTFCDDEPWTSRINNGELNSDIEYHYGRRETSNQTEADVDNARSQFERMIN